MLYDFGRMSGAGECSRSALTWYLKLALSLQEIGIGDDELLRLITRLVSNSPCFPNSRDTDLFVHIPSSFILARPLRLSWVRIRHTHINIANCNSTHDCGFGDEAVSAIKLVVREGRLEVA